MAGVKFDHLWVPAYLKSVLYFALLFAILYLSEFIVSVSIAFCLFLF